MPHLLRHGTSVFVVSSERTAFYGKQGVPKTYSPRNAFIHYQRKLFTRKCACYLRFLKYTPFYIDVCKNLR